MDFLKSNKKVIVWILAIICILSMLITATYRYKPALFNKVISPVITVPQSFIADFNAWRNDKQTYNKENEELVKDMEELKANNDALKMQNSKLELLQKENQRLTNLLGVSESYPSYQQVTARVISKDPTNWYNTFIIDVGTNDGIEPNMVVVTIGGLVGKVVECSGSYSKVVAIVDDFSSVSGIVTRNDALGFVKGDLKLLEDGMIRMEYFDIDAEVMEGDEIVTSHLSSIYPKGIPIGYVSEVYTDAKGLSKYAKVVPYVDFRNLKEVIVFKEDFSKDLGTQGVE